MLLWGSDRVQIYNDAYCDLMGNRHPGGLGQPARDCWPETWHSDERIYARVQDGETVSYRDRAYPVTRHRRQEEACFTLCYSPVRNEDRAIAGVLVTAFETEGELKKSNEELTRANRELEEFAHVASHDLQEPLRMAKVYTQLILKNLDTPNDLVNEYGAFVQQAIVRMETLVRGLLTLSRTAWNDELPVGPADLSASLTEAVSVLKDRIEETRASITARPLPSVRGDTQQLAHVFQNLLSNALKYGKEGVPIEVRIEAEKRGPEWIVAVRDNGIGFESQYAERIFGRFKRLHKEDVPGTGLGLAICRRIVERCGGRIWAEGWPGEGATFYFALPSGE
jgi:light-regulated signal transduction histidine kinase (bacteriophytochrome)